MTTKLFLFLAILPMTLSSSLAGESTSAVYEMRTYYAPPGRLDDLHARFRDHTLKLFEKHGITSIGYWVPIENPDNKLVYLVSYPSLESRDASFKAFFADAEWQDVRKKTEAKGSIVTKVESLFMTRTEYSPEIKPSVAEGRVFELRTYTASAGNLGTLNARFRDHTLKLFTKHGMTNIGYFVLLKQQPKSSAEMSEEERANLGRSVLTKEQPGSDQTLVYILAHKSQEAAKTSFDAFRKDPDWLAARKASEEKGGGSLTVPEGVKSVFLKATDYSPMR